MRRVLTQKCPVHYFFHSLKSGIALERGWTQNASALQARNFSYTSSEHFCAEHVFVAVMLQSYWLQHVKLVHEARLDTVIEHIYLIPRTNSGLMKAACVAFIKATHAAAQYQRLAKHLRPQPQSNTCARDCHAHSRTTPSAPVEMSP